jgi:hypothetical protein
MAVESLEARPDVQERPTAQEVGRERFDRAKEWLSDRWEGAKDRLSSVWKFTKRLGLSIAEKGSALLAPDVVVKNVAAAGKEKGAEAYQHVSEKVKQGANAAAERAIDAWGRAVETKDRIVGGAMEKVERVKERYSQTRESMANRIHNWQTQKEIRRLNDLLKEKAQTMTDLENRRANVKEAIDYVTRRLAELQGQGTLNY